MELLQKIAMFSMGGAGYCGLEMLWRGRTHGSMFVAGGVCFLLLGKLNRTQPRLPLPARAATGALIITMVELATGLLVNRDYHVWDYRQVGFDYHGQICLPYTLLWIPVSLGAMLLYEWADKKIGKAR